MIRFADAWPLLVLPRHRHLRAAMTAALFTALHLFAGTAQSQQPAKAVVAGRVDSMARANMAEKGPASMSIASTRGDDTLVLQAWGLVAVAANRPATTASIYRIGSVTKQFTAVLLLKQVERGRLALTDSSVQYITTGLRPEWRPVTIEHARPSMSLGLGGLCASAGNVAAWNRALHGGRVVSPASYAAMTTPRGAAPRYGFGLQLTVSPWGAPVIYHVGAGGAFAAENAWFPAESLSVTILYRSFGAQNGFPANFILEIARAVTAPAAGPSDLAADGRWP